MILPGVRLIGLRPEMALALALAQQIYLRYQRVEFAITSVVEGKHKRASLHYAGCAADLRRPDNAVQAAELGKALREALGDDFDVIVEVDHIHIEYQPKANF